MSSIQKLSNACVDENVIDRWFVIICKWHSLKDKSVEKPNFERWIPILDYLTKFLPLLIQGMNDKQIDEIIIWLIDDICKFECNNYKVFCKCKYNICKIKTILCYKDYITINHEVISSKIRYMGDKKATPIADKMNEMYETEVVKKNTIKHDKKPSFDRHLNQSKTKSKFRSKPQQNCQSKNVDNCMIPAFSSSAVEGMNKYIFTNGDYTKLKDYAIPKNDDYEINTNHKVANRLRVYNPNSCNTVEDKILREIMSFVNTKNKCVIQSANDYNYRNAAQFLSTHRIRFAVVCKNRILYLIEGDKEQGESMVIPAVEFPEWYVKLLKRDEYTIVDNNWNLYDYDDSLIAAVNIFLNNGRTKPNQYCYKMDNHHFDMSSEKSKIIQCLQNKQLPQILLPKYYSSGCRFCYDSYNLQQCSYCMCCIISTGLVSCRYTSYSNRIYGGYMVGHCNDCKFVYYVANCNCCFNCSYSYRLVHCMCCIDCISLTDVGQINESGFMVNDIITQFQLKACMMKNVIGNHEHTFPVFDFIKLQSNKKSKRYRYTFNTNGVYIDHMSKKIINYMLYDDFDSFNLIESVGNDTIKEIRKYIHGNVLATIIHEEIVKLMINLDGGNVEDDSYGVVEVGLKYTDIPYYLLHLEAMRGYDDWEIFSEESEENEVNDY